MKLIDEIVSMAADGKQPIADALRKCLILAFQLKNEKLKEWTEKELNGFSHQDELPEYRRVSLHSKGNFSGPAGAWIPQRPLPMGILDERDRKMMMTSGFRQAIAAYDGVGDKLSDAIIPWAPDLIGKYQGKFIRGYALSQAWQEVPASMMIGVCEEVRNRLLRFALEIREELGQVHDEPSELAAKKVEAAVVNHIYGGTNVIAGTASNFAQVGTAIVAGDFASLKAALEEAKIPGAEIDELKKAVDEDEGFGKRTKGWLQKFGQTGAKIGATVGQDVLKEWLLQYLGLK